MTWSESLGVALALTWLVTLFPFSFSYWWQRGRDAARSREEQLRQR